MTTPLTCQGRTCTRARCGRTREVRRRQGNARRRVAAVSVWQGRRGAAPGQAEAGAARVASRAQSADPPVHRAHLVGLRRQLAGQLHVGGRRRRGRLGGLAVRLLPGLPPRKAAAAIVVVPATPRPATAAAAARRPGGTFACNVPGLSARVAGAGRGWALGGWRTLVMRSVAVDELARICAESALVVVSWTVRMITIARSPVWAGAAAPAAAGLGAGGWAALRVPAAAAGPFVVVVTGAVMVPMLSLVVPAWATQCGRRSKRGGQAKKGSAWGGRRIVDHALQTCRRRVAASLDHGPACDGL